MKHGSTRMSHKRSEDEAEPVEGCGSQPLPMRVTLDFYCPPILYGSSSFARSVALAPSIVQNRLSVSKGTSLARNQTVPSAKRTWKPPSYRLEMPSPFAAQIVRGMVRRVEVAGLHPVETRFPGLHGENRVGIQIGKLRRRVVVAPQRRSRTDNCDKVRLRREIGRKTPRVVEGFPVIAVFPRERGHRLVCGIVPRLRGIPRAAAPPVVGEQGDLHPPTVERSAGPVGHPELNRAVRRFQADPIRQVPVQIVVQRQAFPHHLEGGAGPRHLLASIRFGCVSEQEEASADHSQTDGERRRIRK